MIVRIDNRETARICEAAKYYMPKYKIQIEELEIGDFIFTDKKESAVFEYKSMTDLMWSINEGRVFNQAIKQSKHFKHHFVIVEWNESEKNKTKKKLKKMGIKMDTQEIYESLAMLSTFTTVLISPSKELSFPLMEKYAQISLEKKAFEKTPENKTNNVVYNFLILIEGIDKIKAHTICKKLNLKTINDLMNVTIKDLIKVPGIGPITAQKIMTSLK